MRMKYFYGGASCKNSEQQIASVADRRSGLFLWLIRSILYIQAAYNTHSIVLGCADRCRLSASIAIFLMPNC